MHIMQLDTNFSNSSATRRLCRVHISSNALNAICINHLAYKLFKQAHDGFIVISTDYNIVENRYEQVWLQVNDDVTPFINVVKYGEMIPLYEIIFDEATETGRVKPV